jgi:hypothetical protein
MNAAEDLVDPRLIELELIHVVLIELTWFLVGERGVAIQASVMSAGVALNG